MLNIIRQMYSQILFPVGWMLGLFVSLFIKKIRLMYIERSRLVEPPLSVQNKNAIWIHCSSGEFEYAKSLIKLIKQTSADTPVVVSYMSPSYKDIIARDKNVDFYFPLPWDFYVKQKELLKKIKPKAVLIARTDFWPQFLFCCKVLKIPTFAFSVRSSGNNWIDNLLQKFRLHEVGKIFCVSEEDQKKLLNSGLSAEPLGDSRWDRVFERLNATSKIEKEIKSAKPIFIAGSTWPKDEDVLSDILFKNPVSDKISTIIIPHEVDDLHINKLTKLLGSKNIIYSLYSQIESWDGTTVLIVDQMGILADFYRLATVAFVGGSFDRSVHSVMEPLGAGVPVLVGPKHTKSREALDFKTVRITDELHALTEIKDVNELSFAFEQIINADHTAIKKIILNAAQKNLGASQRILNKINYDLNT